MPISFSAWRSMSFDTRNGAGVGDAIGVGEGVGDGTWVRTVERFKWGAAIAAAPRAGTSFTKVRRSRLLASVSTADLLARFLFDSDFLIVGCCSCLVDSPATAGGTDLCSCSCLLIPAYWFLTSVFHLDEFCRTVGLHDQNVEIVVLSLWNDW